MYYGYIKDCNDIANRPKSFVRVSIEDESTLNIDLLTSQKSKFSVLNVPQNINNGDIFEVLDSKGNSWYTGKITSYGDNTIVCSQPQSILSGMWKYETPSSSFNTIEEELADITKKLISGKVGNYTDDFIANKYKDFDVICEPSTTGHLPTYDDTTLIDFEEFIYDMYSVYGIVFDINIPYSGKCTIKIYKPDLPSQVIADNVQAIVSVTPTIENMEYNKLIIFSSNNNGTPTYRATYVVTADAQPKIVCLDQESALNRYVETKTKIVFSDDDLDTIVKANLSTDMYNHKVVFDMIIDNKIYNWKNIQIGQPLEIWNKTNYYNTILTGYELTIPNDKEPVMIRLICGKVRTALTDKLKMGV